MANIEEIKKEIQQYLERNLIEEAEKITLNHKNEFRCDEFSSMECIINLYKGNIEKAMQYIIEGLKYNICSGDLYCNMGLVYEIRGEFNRAYLCYEHALEYIDDEGIRNSIENTINMLKHEQNISVNSYSIVILTYNNLEYTKGCIESIRRYNRSNNFEIIIVDNNSSDGTREWIKEQTDIKYILNDENKGFPAGCNQGINKSNPANDIFLLNNDTIIMENSIFNLRMALYSNEKAGAAGAVTNSCSNYQEITEKFSDLEEYKNFALTNNISDERLYEKRIKLIGFAMFIKREALNKTGLLDERFTPGNFEDDDLSYRLIKEGYDLLLCLDSYIHHFGGASFKKSLVKYNELLKINSEKFKEKWGFFSECKSVVRYSILTKIDKGINEKFNVLEIGCGCGGTLLAIKNIFKNAEIYGMEKNKSAADIAQNFIQMKSMDLEDMQHSNEGEYLDYIIINDMMEDAKELLYIKEIASRYLKNSGKILTCKD